MTPAAGKPRPRGLTHRDLDDTPDDGNRWEVIDGELHVSPFPSPKHQRVITQLAKLIATFVDSHGLGQVFVAGLKVVLDEPTGVGPDLVYISNARLDGLQDDGFYGAPDLIVEVLSTKPGLDRHVKREKYARACVPHDWIIDPIRRTLEAYAPEGVRYGWPVELADDATYAPDWLPGLIVPLRDLWG
jgi:Uma2 family endonuclease